MLKYGIWLEMLRNMTWDGCFCQVDIHYVLPYLFQENKSNYNEQLATSFICSFDENKTIQ